MIRLGIVSPCYNEHEVLRESASRLSALLDELVAKGKITPDSIVFYVNDGSMDDTWQIISELHATNKYICGVNLAHNVGHQNAIMAGMMVAKDVCDGVVTIDADLQDDITAIEKMVDCHAAGKEVVYGVKVSRKGDSFIKRTMAISFYKLQSSMGVKALYNHADFRFMSKKALFALSQFSEKNLYLRGLIPTMGFPYATVDDVISPRFAGSSKYTLQKMLRLAVDGITSFSTKPIALITTVGLAFLFIAVLMAIYVIVSLFNGHSSPGWASLMASIWFIGSVLMISIGIIGQYIGKIYIEVKNRPLYIVDEVLMQKKDE